MEMIWSIKLYKTKLGYKVKIEGKDGQADADAPTPHKAYKAAEAKLVIKPWLTSNSDTK
ncbi:MAG: hypothetical protein Q7S46_00665 [Gallionella sp.]|nr:hypothetical protein [Gallionella sp.]